MQVVDMHLKSYTRFTRAGTMGLLDWMGRVVMDKSEAPKKIWLEYAPDEQHLHLTDELVWTGYLTEYVRADCHERLVEALEEAVRVMTDGNEMKRRLAAKGIESLLAQLQAGKGGEL